MIKFRQLFAFKKNEVKASFEAATLFYSKPGLKLLKAPSIAPHGKLLIVLPRKFGKAHERNLIRRQLKAIFYEEQLYKQPVVWLLILYFEAKKLDFPALKKFLTSVIKHDEARPH
jgi:ribonuclease P protein component